MNNKKSQRLLITKLEAARKQLNAAIRMFFRNDDDLAIHTVGHAAFQLIRDLAGRHQDLQEYFMTLGLFEMLKAYAKGQLDPSISEDDGFKKLVSKIPDSTLTLMAETDFKNVQATLKDFNSAQFWGNFKKSYNFLKHAERDPAAELDFDRINNAELLEYALASFAHLDQPLSVEMQIFHSYFLSLQTIKLEPPEELTKLVETLKHCDGVRRKQACRVMIGDTLDIVDDHS